jgi:hypothetical protein
MTEISIHFERTETPITAIVNESKPEYVFLVNPPAVNPFPGIKTIGRFFTTDEYVNQGAAGATRWWAENSPRVAACPWLWGIVTCNEPQGDWRFVDDYVAEWVDICHQLFPTLKTVAWNFSFGGPEPEEYVHFLSSAAKADCYGFHEYWTPAQWANQAAWAGWTFWRYKKFIAALPAALRDKPVFITESGIDMSENYQGWRSEVSENEYLNEFELYLAGLTPNVKAVFVYEAGAWPLWYDFELTPYLATELLKMKKEEPVVPPVQTLIIDGRLMNAEEFENHVKQTNFSWANTIVIHHTFKPNKADWATVGWHGRKENMRQYYQGLGWESGPHLFVSDEGIGLFSPLSARGTGVTDNNTDTIHIEIVGDYTNTFPTGLTYFYVIKAIVALKKKKQLAVMFHKQLEPGGLTECPGRGITVNWSVFMKDVNKAFNSVDLSQEEPTPTKIRWHVEEVYRGLKAMGVDVNSEPMQRLYELIRLDGGLLYRFEQGGY